VSCTSATTCVAVGTGTAGPAIVSTVDGGSDWQPGPVPAGVSALTSISCSSASTCVAGGTTGAKGALIETGDGGRSWAPVPLAAGAQVARVLGVVCPPGSGCTALARDDSGAVHILVPNPQGALVQFPSQPQYNGRTFFVLPCQSACSSSQNLSGTAALAILDPTTAVQPLGQWGGNFVCLAGDTSCWSVGPTVAGYGATRAG